MGKEEAGTAQNPKTAEEAQVLDDEELTRIVGGTGHDGNDDDDDDEMIFWGTSDGPDWSSDG